MVKAMIEDKLEVADDNIGPEKQNNNHTGDAKKGKQKEMMGYQLNL